MQMGISENNNDCRRKKYMTKRYPLVAIYAMVMMLEVVWFFWTAPIVNL